MRIWRLTMIVSLLLVVVGGSAALAWFDDQGGWLKRPLVVGKSSFQFVGLWQGIDRVDYDPILLSITADATNGGGVSFRLLTGRTVISSCTGGNMGGIGAAEGPAVLQDGNLVSTEFELFCIESPDDRMNEPLVLVPDKYFDTLSFRFTNETEDRAILHRIDSQPRGRR